MKGCGDKGFKENHLVFLDKNYPRDQIDRIISEVNGYLPGNVVGRFLYLIPQCDINNSIFDLPVTASFLLQAMARTQKRTNH